MKNIVMGIDASKETLDICTKKEDSMDYETIENSIKGVKSFFKKYKGKSVVVAMENTGRYNWSLYEVLEGHDFKVYVIPPLHLKRSLGLTRGKNDKIDALRICNFILKNQEETTQWQPTPLPIKKIKILMTERNSRMKMKKALLSQQKDYRLMKSTGLHKDLLKMNQTMVKNLNAQIKLVERKLQETIKEDDVLKRQFKLIKSVPGAGKVIGWTLLAKTEAFTLITDPRKMACYSGVVPFENRSGTSVFGRPRVSFFADKQIKTVLHMGAMSAIRLKNELRDYYERKVADGKNKMSVLNAVRNKIIHRIFAVIKNDKPYEKRLVLS